MRINFFAYFAKYYPPSPLLLSKLGHPVYTHHPTVSRLTLDSENETR